MPPHTVRFNDFQSTPPLPTPPPLATPKAPPAKPQMASLPYKHPYTQSNSSNPPRKTPKRSSSDPLPHSSSPDTKIKHQTRHPSNLLTSTEHTLNLMRKYPLSLLAPPTPHPTPPNLPASLPPFIEFNPTQFVEDDGISIDSIGSPALSPLQNLQLRTANPADPRPPNDFDSQSYFRLSISDDSSNGFSSLQSHVRIVECFRVSDDPNAADADTTPSTKSPPQHPNGPFLLSSEYRPHRKDTTHQIPIDYSTPLEEEFPKVESIDPRLPFTNSFSDEDLTVPPALKRPPTDHLSENVPLGHHLNTHPLLQPQSKNSKMVPVRPPLSSSFINSLIDALDWTPPKRSPPNMRFRFSPLAARTNSLLLESAKGDIAALLRNDGPNSPMQIGSEFRPAHLLDSLLSWHPFWPSARNTMFFGAEYHQHPISDKDRIQDLVAALRYGNHKSAQFHRDTLMDNIKKDISKGWILPFLPSSLAKIPGAIVSPMGVSVQQRLQSDGTRAPNPRPTHDLSFTFSSGHSVNSRVTGDNLNGLVYGFAAKRLIHQIVAMRAKFPETALFISKADVKSAFRRIQTHPSLAPQMITTTKDLADDPDKTLALLHLRLSFGGKPNPFLWSDLSELAADAARLLSACPDWDHKSLHSPHAHLIGKPIRTQKEIPFATARALLVDVLCDAFGSVEVFIDDFISIIPDTPAISSPDRPIQAVLLILEAIGRPSIGIDDPLFRDALVALDKLLAEGTPSETPAVLGWNFDTRQLLVSLPSDKTTSWINDIRMIIDSKRRWVTHKQLESLIGRLTNAASVLNQGHHFLSRLRGALKRANQFGGTHLSLEEALDGELWISFLNRLQKGIDMNLLVFRLPDTIHRGDACTYQMGGFSLKTGMAWRFKIPENLLGRHHINFLEFLTCYIGYCWERYTGGITAGDCIASITDNTSADAWIAKSNFAPDDEAQASHFALARHFAARTLDDHTCLFSQWDCGANNPVADCLSRNHSLDDESLTLHILKSYPKQVPNTFQVSPLPEELISEICFWLQHKPLPRASPPAHKQNTTPPGAIGSPSSDAVNFPPPIPIWIPSDTKTKSTSLDASCNRTERATGPNPLKDTISWLRKHALPPSVMWQRPLLQPADPTPGKMQQEILTSFYNVNNGATLPTTLPPNTKKRSRSPSSPR